MKQTEGNWIAVKAGKNYDITNGFSLIASVKNIEEIEANAKCIAESKTMLLQLKEEVEYLDHWMKQLDKDGELYSQMKERKEFFQITIKRATVT